MKIVTHNGQMHADEITAVALLQLATGEAEVEVVRIGHAEPVPADADVVVDVGRVYDQSRLLDHHQVRDCMELSRVIKGKQYPYAAAGLVWKHYGQKVVENVLKGKIPVLHPRLQSEAREFADFAQMVELKCIVPIDVWDCGLKTPFSESAPTISWSQIVSTFNPIDEDPDLSDASFLMLVRFVELWLANAIQGLARKVNNDTHAITCVDAAIAEGRRYVVSEVPIFHLGQVACKIPEACDILFVVYPNPQGKWFVKTIEQAPRVPRKPLPKAWAGLEGRELRLITGVETAVFAHNGRFLAAAETLEGAIMLAQLAIAEPEEQEVEPVTS